MKQVVAETVVDNKEVESKVSTLSQENNDVSFLDNPQKAVGKQLTVENWKLVLARYNQYDTYDEKWVYLGGDLEKFEFKPMSEKRSKLSQLRQDLRDRFEKGY
ncbi:hypothetical protein JCM19233_4513 [Vibrio astriarenae]|nr:hypothetical protein JCM19233_4513 [Vibrio sp. C7]